MDALGGHPQIVLERQNESFQQAFEKKEKQMVGVNAFVETDEVPLPILYIDDSAHDIQLRRLAELKTFILPGGSPAASFLHQARTVCRRAERRVLSSRAVAQVRPEIIVYLNRLSDLLFVLAREANRLASHEERAWAPRG